MARRRGRSGLRSAPYDVRTGESYDSFSSADALPRSRGLAHFEEQGDLLRSLRGLAPEAAVYPWQRSQPLRVYPVSPYRQSRSDLIGRARSIPVSVLGVRVPQKVAFCVRRKQRREVLFALNRAGYSGSARKRFWRRTSDSHWRC